MLSKPRYFTSLLLVAGITALVAPIPALAKGAGTMAPRQTIKYLESRGYDVRINWVHGAPGVIPLSECVVTDINTTRKQIAFVSIKCPPAR